MRIVQESREGYLLVHQKLKKRGGYLLLMMNPHMHAIN